MNRGRRRNRDRPAYPPAMRGSRLVAVTVIASLSGAGCGGDDSAALPTVDCAPPVPTFAEVTAFRSNCANCHSVQLGRDDRQGAPVGMDYDVYASAVAVAEATARSVFDRSMPPSGGITAADTLVLYRWSLCGTPP